MIFRISIIAMTAMSILSGCGSLNQSDYRLEKPSKDFGVAVIGVSSESVDLTVYDLYKSPMIQIVRIKKDGEYAKHANVFSLGEHGRIEDGYAYVSLPPTNEGERYVVLNYLTNGFLGSKVNLMCYRQPTATFEVKKGDVIYVGDYSIFNMRGTKNLYLWEFGFARNISRAIEDINKKHPELADKVKEANLIYWPADFGASCRSGDS